MFRDTAESLLTSLSEIATQGTGFLTLLVFCLSFLGIYLIARPKSAQMAVSSPNSAPDRTITCRFAGQTCQSISTAAESFLGCEGRKNAWPSLMYRFSADKDIAASLFKLQSHGIRFRKVTESIEGRFYKVSGAPVGGFCQVDIEDVTESELAKRALRAELETARSDLEEAQAILQNLPVMAWITDAEGGISWSNNSFQAARGGRDGPLFGETDITQGPPGKPIRAAISDPDDTKRWFDVERKILHNGAALYTAQNAGRTVEAEETLHRFISTLTETFAHVPTGLAIFDADRLLGMFNPALAELLEIDPTWLAGRPDFTSFLERLREQRKMPEARDLLAWRQTVSAIEAASTLGEFTEDWDLPGNITLRVTGRPHPKGALALLFEDISTAKALEQKYRTEIELNETILDSVSEALVVFDTAGVMVFSNEAFQKVWGFTPQDIAPTPTIQDMKKAWASHSGALKLFDRAQGFVTGTGERSAWRAQFDINDGKTLVGQFAPLPDGSTLMTFIDITSESAIPETEDQEDISLTDQLAVDLNNQRDLVGLSLQHLKSYIARLDRKDSREIRATLGDKLNMLEGLLWGASASSDPVVSSQLFEGDLSSAITAGRNQGLDVSLTNKAAISEVFRTAGIGPQFLNSVLVLLGALVANGGKASVDGAIDELSGNISILYQADVAPDLEERRFTLVTSLMRELAQQYDVRLSFEPGPDETSIRATFNFPLLPEAPTKLRSIG